jgi:ArsR family transcriptional regulator
MSMKTKPCSESDLFKAIGDRTRYNIVLILLDGERCACELPKLVKRAQPTVSLQLKYLLEAGVLASRRQGKKIIYSVRDKRVQDMFKALGHKCMLCMKKRCCQAE